MDKQNLRELVLNIRRPLIIKNVKIPWKCFQLTPQEWCKCFDEQSVEGLHNFDKAEVINGDYPQWEKYREKILVSCEEFFCKSSGARSKNDKIDSSIPIDFFEKHWASLCYQSCSKMPDTCKNGISFDCFGFPTDEENCTFWLSSKNAHTSCHYDTYGCNIVVQVFGRKQWLLFPPDTPLSPVRVPYEESSVYCSENFFSPNDLSQFTKVKEFCHLVILEPGDVLIVPRNWWHYVENLETSLSVNTWIPLEIDTEAQLDECIVKYTIENLIKDQSDNEKFSILNPNQQDQIASDKEILNILNFLANNAITTEPDLKVSQRKYPYMYLPLDRVDKLMTSFDSQYVNNISKDEFIKLMKLNSRRFKDSVEKNAAATTEPEMTKVKEILINSICHPSIIKEIRNSFLDNYKKTYTK